MALELVEDARCSIDSKILPSLAPSTVWDKNIPRKVSLNVFLAGTMLSDSNDRWSWSLVGSGEFLVASVRKLIDEHRLGGSSHKTRWIHTVPIKINILAWKVQYDFFPTRLNLSRRGRLLLGGSFLMWSLIRMKVGWSGFYR
nr:RNA-directed DNA polymerase, eukaryota [Tanacetum cinerariifolium]